MSTLALPAPSRWPNLTPILLAGTVLVALLIMLAMPLVAILGQAVRDPATGALSWQAIEQTLASPGLLEQLQRSLAVALTTCVLVVPLAYAYASALTRSCMPGKSLFRALALIPLLAPSLLPGIALVYLFGNQGVLKGLFPDGIYGFWGIVLGEAFYTFPHALMILLTALAVADGRLYEAAHALGANGLRRFLTVTLPGARFGLISATMVVFTLVITDFGVPKVIGGQYSVLALEAYKR
ncbi:ABC transporter permease subunit [Chitinibacter tainanensis]|uniref:ABC transporter permease subunit n=1 Tax=Chitinibacter tainanensis TaxID=230667 RepID=UPI0003FEE49F|nr:ABC transporter permease subunit [Chitinibacter tainanensis]